MTAASPRGSAETRFEAQRRAEQIQAFRAELARLQAAGVLPLTPQQEGELAAYHDRLLRRLSAEFDVDATESAGQLSRGMRVLSFFAAATLTAAIYSLVERYWGRFDLPLQATLLALFPIAALFAVEWTSTRERSQYVSSLFALVAYGTFWLALGVLSWTVNIPITPPFLWLGVVFGLALAIPYGFRIVVGLALLAFAIAMAGTIFQLAGTEWTVAFERLEPLMLAGFSTLLVALPLARVDRTLLVPVRLVGFGVGLLCLLVLSMSGQTSVFDFATNVTEGVYQGVMCVACIVTIAISIRRGWMDTMHLAAAMLALFLLSRFLDWFWDVLPRYVFFLTLALFAFAWLLLLRTIRGRLIAARG